ncbi:hypothetical protein IEN85_23735 [Pelagicoccus sp. NFK12]|uniref:Outer membrane lipoprotein-sorting protein n=1 Tax=Pelagicoccus enzymogenes TaxID=2773457 RepID=A0A927FDR7_9BACT|nr:hypothetical protein [Pelagicoccus enzymogenes]MBD5782531.1 hypothetical protein [Pelagicoccus enzymogenes]
MNRIFPKSVAFFATLLILSSNAFAQKASELSDAEKEKIIKETVALGREYMGGDAKLNAIQSVRFEGVLVQPGGMSGTVESVMKKPGYYQFISSIGGIRETSTLAPTGAWRKLENFREPGAYTLSFYDVEELRNLEATISDSLGFLKAPKTRNGRIEFVGKGKVRGKQAVILNYVYSDGIWFRRYFNPETGRVMFMQSSKGMVFTYEGDIEVDGVRFPKKVLVTYVSQYGESTMEISYSKAEVNLEVDLQRFRVPQVGE